MSRMSELHMEIAEMIEEGKLSFREIAFKLEIPYDWVTDVADSLYGFYNETYEGEE